MISGRVSGCFIVSGRPPRRAPWNIIHAARPHCAYKQVWYIHTEGCYDHRYFASLQVAQQSRDDGRKCFYTGLTAWTIRRIRVSSQILDPSPEPDTLHHVYSTINEDCRSVAIQTGDF